MYNTKETNIQDEFVQAVEQFHKEAEQAFTKANEAEKELLALSEKYGVPFQSPVSCLYNEYTPITYIEKYKGKVVDAGEICNVYSEGSLYYPGWAHSSVC